MKELNFNGFSFAGVAEEDNLDYFFSEDEVGDTPEYGVVINLANAEETLDILDDADIYSVIEDIEVPIQGGTPELVAVPFVAATDATHITEMTSSPHSRGRKSRRQLRKDVKKTSFQEVVHGKFGRPVGVR